MDDFKVLDWRSEQSDNVLTERAELDEDIINQDLVSDADIVTYSDGHILLEDYSVSKKNKEINPSEVKIIYSQPPKQQFDLVKFIKDTIFLIIVACIGFLIYKIV